MSRVSSAMMGFLMVALTCAPMFRMQRVAAQDIQQSQKSDAIAQAASPTALRVPDGTLIEIEAPYTLSSMDFKTNDKISFHVVDPVKVNGITVIEQGATATGRVDKSKRGGHFGKAGIFVWTMQTVTAVDGLQIPLRLSPQRLKGDSKGGQVATAMIIGGVLLGPAAPLVLLHGFKRGKDAFIPAGKRYSVFVATDSAVTPDVHTKSKL